MPKTLKLTSQLNLSADDSLNTVLDLFLNHHNHFACLTRNSKKRLIEQIFSSYLISDISAIISILHAHKKLHPKDFKKLKFNRKIFLNTESSLKSWDNHMKEMGDEMYSEIESMGIDFELY